tara:strand:- start:1792 stop:2433 length:642 start_codon:yes stop_codon:yes gene_type:complete
MRKNKVINNHTFSFSGSQLNQLKNMPRLTEKGFKKSKVPKKIFENIIEAYKIEKQNFKPEPTGVTKNSVINLQEDVQASYITENVYFLKWILEKLRTHHEEWCEIPLHNSQAYGFRKYVRGAFLLPHADRHKTHIISSIINVEQKVDEPWPLEIIGYDEKMHKIYLEPGEMLFYESAKLLHGRTTYFKGDYFVNLFLHYRPQNWDNMLETIKI